MKKAYIKTIYRSRGVGKRVSNTPEGYAYKRYEVVMKDNGQTIGRSGILQSRKKAEEYLQATKKRWERMSKRK